jgi:hypothetical protein
MQEAGVWVREEPFQKLTKGKIREGKNLQQWGRAVAARGTAPMHFFASLLLSLFFLSVCEEGEALFCLDPSWCF